MKKHLIKKAEQGISFSGFDEKWGNRAREVYGKNKDAAVWKQMAGDDNVITQDELKAWQKAQGVAGDGKMGAQTISKLGVSNTSDWIPFQTQKGLSFDQAHAQARKAGAKTFKWNGRTFATEMRSAQKVYTTGLDIPEEELKRHPEKFKQVQQERVQASLAPIKTAHNIDQVSGKDTTLYSYGENVQGQPVYIANRDLNAINALKEKLKTLDPASDEYSQVLDQIDTLRSESFTTVMDDTNVVALAKYAADKDGNGGLTAREGWLPVETSGSNPMEGRIFKKTSGGDQYYITNKRGWIIGTSNDPRIITDDYENATVSRRDHSRESDLKAETYRQAMDQIAQNEIDTHIANGYNPETGKYDVQLPELIQSMNDGKSTFAGVVSHMARKPLGLAFSTGRLLTNAAGELVGLESNYTPTDYWNELTMKNLKNNSGAGDIIADFGQNFYTNDGLWNGVRVGGNFIGDAAAMHFMTKGAPAERMADQKLTQEAQVSQPIYGDKATVTRINRVKGFRTPNVKTVVQNDPHHIVVNADDIAVPMRVEGRVGGGGGKVFGTNTRVGNASWEGMGTTQGNKGIWGNGGSRVQVGGTTRTISTPGTTAQNGIGQLTIDPVLGWTRPVAAQTTNLVNPIYWTHNLTHENTPIEPMVYEPDFAGTEVVTKKQPWIMDWMVDGIQPEGNYNVIPTEENTQGGNVTWVDTDGTPIVSTQGTGTDAKRDTSGKPSKRTGRKKQKKQNGGVLRKGLISKAFVN